MAIITKPTNVYKDYENVYTVSVAELLLHPKVSPDSYFNNSSNWKTVFVVYEADNSNQRENVEFEIAEAQTTGLFEITDTGRNNWKIQALIIQDFDMGYLRLEREDLDFNSLDFTALPPPIMGAPVLDFVNISPVTADASNNDVITLTFTSNEIIQNISTTIAGQSASVSGSGSSWTATYMLSGIESAGNVSFSIDFEDLQNEQGVTVTSTTDGSSSTIEYSEVTLYPVTIVASNNIPTNEAVVGSNIIVSFTSSDTIQNIVATIAEQPANVTNTVGMSYTATYVMTGSEPQGNVEFTIDYEDQFGNQQTQVNATDTTSADTEVIFDSIAPTLSSVTIASNNADTTIAEEGDTISLSFTSSEPIQNESVSIAGNSADTITNISGDDWVADYTVQAGDATGVVQFLIDFDDSHGNSGVTVSSITSGDNVIIQTSSLNSAISGNSAFNGPTFAMVEAPDADLIIGGQFTNYANSGYNKIIKISKSGILDNTFCTNANAAISGANGVLHIIKQPVTNKYIIITLGSGNYSIKRLDQTGALDATFNNYTPNDYIAGVLPISSGELFIYGRFTTYDGIFGNSYLVKLSIDGITDISFKENAVHSATFGQMLGDDVVSAGIVNGNLLFTGYIGFYPNKPFPNRGDSYSSGIVNMSGVYQEADSETFSNLNIGVGSNRVIKQLQDSSIYIGIGLIFGGDILHEPTVLNSDYTINNTFNITDIKGRFNGEFLELLNGDLLVKTLSTNFRGVTGREPIATVDSDGNTVNQFCIDYIDGQGLDIEYFFQLSDGTIAISGYILDYNGQTGVNHLIFLE